MIASESDAVTVFLTRAKIAEQALYCEYDAARVSDLFFAEHFSNRAHDAVNDCWVIATGDRHG